MAKVSMKMTREDIIKSQKTRNVTKAEQMRKSKVKKYDGSNFMKIEDAIYGCTKEEQNALKEALEEFVTGYDLDSFLEEWFGVASNILDGVNGADGYDFEKSKTIKGKSPKEIGKDLIAEGIKVFNVDEYDNMFGIYVPWEHANRAIGFLPVDAQVLEVIPYKGDQAIIRISKSKTLMDRQSPADILKSKGWVRKEKDNGPDSEDVENGAGVESEVKVPDTPEPSDNVEDTETKVPEIDDLIEEGEKNEKMGDKEGDDIEALQEEGGTNNDVPKEMDDIDALIEKKRQQNGYYNGTPAPTVGSTQPYANNYRTTQMGEGKMDVMSQLSNPKTMTSKSTKGMTGSRKRA